MKLTGKNQQIINFVNEAEKAALNIADYVSIWSKNILDFVHSPDTGLSVEQIVFLSTAATSLRKIGMEVNGGDNDNSIINMLRKVEQSINCKDSKPKSK